MDQSRLKACQIGLEIIERVAITNLFREKTISWPTGTAPGKRGYTNTKSGTKGEGHQVQRGGGTPSPTQRDTKSTQTTRTKTRKVEGDTHPSG